MEETFKRYMNALAGALRQELPDVLNRRVEFAVDGKPYVITADEGGPLNESATAADPGTVHVADTKRFLQQMVELDVRGSPPNEKLAVQNWHDQIMDGVRERQIEQTETMTNAQIVGMVENVIRDNPKDFPLLTKYYLNAE